MSILPQQNNILKSPLQNARHSHLTGTTLIRCAATVPTKPKSSATRVVIGPGTSGLPSTQVMISTRAPRPDDPDLKSTTAHRAWVVGGCTTVLISLAKSVTAASGSHVLTEPIVAGLVGYILADLGTGVYHWGIDNYGNATTPIFGAQIEAFQGHHKWPWTITKRQFANNLHSLARIITFTVLPLDVIVDDPTLLAFIGSLSGCIMFSQQFHAWAHATKSKLPKVVVGLQELGLLVSRPQHAAHHRPPYNGNYCIVSGIWNKLLDENRVFEMLEMILFFKLGIRPRSWSEPNLEWVEETSSP